MDDSIHHRQLRQELVKKIAGKGITDKEVLEAISKVPRHLFISSADRRKEAYEDIPLSIGSGQTISQPFTVAYQTQLLNVNKKHKVLEIGTGSGYQSAVLFELGAELYSLERQKDLYSIVKPRLMRLGYSSIQLFLRDGYEGLEEQAPFDRILVTAGAESVPQILKIQLKVGGVMVIPVGKTTFKMLRLTKTSDTSVTVEEFEDFHFVPLLNGITGV